VVEQTGGEIIVQCLESYGVEVVFGIPGEHNIEIYRALGKSAIRHVTPRHEQGAGFMADAYARVSGKVGVAIVVTGPGLTNIATPMAQAYTDSIPLLVISGQVRSDLIGKGGHFHELKNQIGFSGALVGWSQTVKSAAQIPEVMERAFRDLSCGTSRGIHLEFPQDILLASAHVSFSRGAQRQASSTSQFDLRSAATVLAKAISPGLIVGGGGRHAGPELLVIAERIGAPILTTWRGSGAVPASHPLSAGIGTEFQAAKKFLETCDALLIVGTELSETDFFPSFPKTDAKIVRIDHDPQRISRGCLCDVGLVADARTAAHELGLALESHEQRPNTGSARAAVLRNEIDREAAVKAGPYRATVEAIRAALPPHAVLACDLTGPVYYAVSRHFPVDLPNRILQSGLGTLGFSIPAAIGAKIANSDCPVVALVGDGGFMFTAPELMTAAELGLNLVVVVWNNQGFGDIRSQMIQSGARPVGVDLVSPDFKSLAKGFRSVGVTVQKPSGFRQQLDLALQRTCPTIIEIASLD